MAELHLHWQQDGTSHDARISDAAPAVIGRLAESDVPVRSERVSRRHVRVRRRGEGFTVTDLTDGRNPVTLNGAPLTAETLLRQGDTVVLGDVLLTVAQITGIGPADGPALALRWSLGGQTHTESVRGGDPAVIGRDDTAAIQIDVPTVSRAHARIMEHNGRFAITDLTAGRNPVGVNNQPVMGERFLNAGDVIHLGHSGIDVHVTAVSTHATPQSVRLVTCVHCHREVDGTLFVCPWCGTSLDIAQTVIP